MTSHHTPHSETSVILDNLIARGQDDRLIESNRQFKQWLDSKEVRYTWVESPGAHSLRVWHRYLAELSPQLFLEKK